jgi:acetyltransferase-like isoleucine patch superfamily enzyme
VRNPVAEIIIGNIIWIKNNADIVAEHGRIEIGDNTQIGPDFMIVDSDFHDLDPSRTISDIHETSTSIIGANVCVGARVEVLKGVSIGGNSVIAIGPVFMRSVPANCLACEAPIRFIKWLNSNA